MAINSINGSPPAPVRGNGQIGRVASAKPEKLPGAGMLAQPVREPDELQLTPESLHLRKLEATLGKETAFDQERVEALRKAVTNGEYRVNSARVAEKMLKFESELFI